MKYFESQKGFSLVEMMVVVVIIGILATVMILNFRGSGSQMALRQVTQQVMSDIRRAQSLAIASTQFEGEMKCGFGIYYVDSTTYAIYTGDTVGDCDTENRNFELGIDQTYRGLTMADRQIVFRQSFPDIFFEPPDPKTYIDNSSLLSGPNAEIKLGIVDGICPDDCLTIIIRPSGLVEVQ